MFRSGSFIETAFQVISSMYFLICLEQVIKNNKIYFLIRIIIRFESHFVHAIKLGYSSVRILHNMVMIALEYLLKEYELMSMYCLEYIPAI